MKKKTWKDAFSHDTETEMILLTSFRKMKLHCDVCDEAAAGRQVTSVENHRSRKH